MVQYLVVRYDRRRRVFIDSKKSGFTNSKLRVSKGVHKVELGEPANFSPRSRRPDVKGTSVGNPMVIEFERIEEGETA